MTLYGRSVLCLLAVTITAGTVNASAREPSSISPPHMQQGAILNLTLVEILSGIGKRPLTGIFAFVPTDQVALAFANFLLFDHKALKRFVKFEAKRFKKAGALTYWEKQVLLFLVGMNEQKKLPPGMRQASEKIIGKVSGLALSPGTTPEDYRARVLTRGNR